MRDILGSLILRLEGGGSQGVNDKTMTLLVLLLVLLARCLRCCLCWRRRSSASLLFVWTAEVRRKILDPDVSTPAKTTYTKICSRGVLKRANAFLREGNAKD
jgi:hypothetical protein